MVGCVRTVVGSARVLSRVDRPIAQTLARSATRFQARKRGRIAATGQLAELRRVQRVPAAAGVSSGARATRAVSPIPPITVKPASPGLSRRNGHRAQMARQRAALRARSVTRDLAPRVVGLDRSSMATSMRTVASSATPTPTSAVGPTSRMARHASRTRSATTARASLNAGSDRAAFNRTP